MEDERKRHLRNQEINPRIPRTTTRNPLTPKLDLRTMAPIPVEHQSTWEVFKLWFASNRAGIGGALLALAGLLATIDSHPAFGAGAKVAEQVAYLILGGAGLATFFAGKFKSDQYWDGKRRDASGKTIPPSPVESFPVPPVAKKRR